MRCRFTKRLGQTHYDARAEQGGFHGATANVRSGRRQKKQPGNFFLTATRRLISATFLLETNGYGWFCCC